ncbi:MAG: hypothetical protein SGPRY_003372 [Prymnesium sp.]
MPRLRSRAHPAGLPGLGETQRAYLERHNRLALITAEIALVAVEAGATYVIENPVDRGMRRSRHFSWRTRQHTPLWLLLCMRTLARESAPSSVSFPQCAFRDKNKKWTTLTAAGPSAVRLLAVGSLQCTHARHTKRAKGYDESTGDGAAESAEYPPPYVRNAGLRPEFEGVGWAAAVGTFDERDGSRQPARDSAHAAERANQRACAAFCAGELAAATEGDHIRCVGDPEKEGGDIAGPRQPAGGVIRIRGWKAAPEAIPPTWPEREDVAAAAVLDARSQKLRYISRRKADPESLENLMKRPWPSPSDQPSKEGGGQADLGRRQAAQGRQETCSPGRERVGGLGRRRSCGDECEADAPLCLA